ncbi:hypothetical protein GOP47_0020869 [Adiantum capillus-veneris]|uniref:Telomerase reverse transcriptase n=1 Tax=Adiantum capillus-veneris TaxID=13818 RepID=A0A9D4UBK4_ADICA|nr:hypothetical protein GOP47_0020869 [Adiantum capillus-veneris]
MGSRKKRKRGRDGQQRHVERRILPLLYPSSCIRTLHDLLVDLILPSLQEYHARSSQSASLAGKGSEVLLRPMRLAGIDMCMQQRSLGSNFHKRRDTPPAVANPVDASGAPLGTSFCQATSPTSADYVLRRKPAATSDTNLMQQLAPTVGMDADLFAAAHLQLVHEGDPEDYLSLLHQCYVVLPDTAPPVESTTMLEQRWSHQQVIDRVIQMLFKQGRNTSNVLCFGFQQPRPRSSLESERSAPAGLACVTDNAAVRILNSETWRKIHSRVGDSIMLHLLSYADIFHPLPHKCYIQVTGTSVLLLAQNFKRPRRALPTKEGSIERRDALLEQERLVGLNSKDTCKSKTCGHSNINSCTDERSKEWVKNRSVYDGNATARKRERPFSCQRWKMTKLTAGRADEGCSIDILERCGASVELGRLVRSNGSDSGKVKTYVHGNGSRCTDERSKESISNGSVYDGNATAKKRQRPHSWQRRKMKKLTAGRIEEVCSSYGIETSELHMVVDSQEFQVKASEFHHSSFLDAARDGPATQGKFSEAVGVEVAALEKFNRSDSICKLSGLQKPGEPDEENCRPILPILGSCSLPRVLSTSDEQSKIVTNNSPEKIMVHTSLFLVETLSYGNEQEQGKKGGNSGVPSPRNTSRSAVVIGAGRRFINRSRMFYRGKFAHHAGLPKSHLLQRLKPTYKDAAILFEAIFGNENSSVSNTSRKRSSLCLNRCSKSICRLLKKVILNAQKCQFARLLKRHCPSSITSLSQSPENKFSPKDLEAKGMFKLRHSEYSLYPEQCLNGCCHHKKSGTSSRASIQKHDKLEFSDCSRLGSAGRCPQDKTRSHQLLKQSMLESWIYWLFSGLIVPLIQAHFYVTESEKFKQNVLFYRKSVWANIKSFAVKQMVKCNFKRLNVKSTFRLLKEGSLGFSRGRLLPKKLGTRLIANLGSSSTFSADCVLANVALSGNESGRRKKSENLSKACHQKVSIRETQRNSLSFKPINIILRDIHNCLKYEQEKHEEHLGCSVFDYNDAYLKLLPYIISHKRASTANSPVYLVVCDAFKAFDTVKQDKLMEIVCEFVREEEYSVRRFGYASPNMKSVKVFHERSTTSAINSLTPLDCLLTTAEKQRNAVCIDLAHSVKLRRSHVLQILKEHLLRNILRIGQHYYLQVVGIPQGSILSSLLCSLYYGHFERSRLAGILHLGASQVNGDRYWFDIKNGCEAFSCIPAKTEGTSYLMTHSSAQLSRLSSFIGFASSSNRVSSQNHGLGIQCILSLSCKRLKRDSPAGREEESMSRNILLRLVDDWLLISNSRNVALEFVRRMHRGFAEYNCVANRTKTAVNFDAAMGESAINMNIYRTADGACFIRWSGLLVNCNTLEIQADYTRYCGFNIRSTLTVWRRNNEGIFLMTKLCQFMRPKCHPIFYDGNINCPATVFLNAYQSFTLCAMKFHAYVCSLPCQGKCNSKFGLRAVLKCSRYMHSLLVHRIHKIAKRSPVKPLLLLQAKEAQWLALKAFQKVLMRKQSRHTKLLYLIKSELLSSKYEGLDETPLMLSALDARRSSMFESILY